MWLFSLDVESIWGPRYSLGYESLVSIFKEDAPEYLKAHTDSVLWSLSYLYFYLSGLLNTFSVANVQKGSLNWI